MRSNRFPTTSARSRIQTEAFEWVFTLQAVAGSNFEPELLQSSAASGPG